VTLSGTDASEEIREARPDEYEALRAIEDAADAMGRALVNAVCGWAVVNGLPAVTLTTFRDVAWNGPFYAGLGFREVEDLSPGLAAMRAHERAIGDDNFGPRIAMREDLA